MNTSFSRSFFSIGLVSLMQIAMAQPDSWKQRHSLYNLVAGRSDAVGFSLNGKGYLATGFSFGFGVLGGWNNDLWQYDTLTNTWTQMASMPGKGRQSAASFVINNKAYVGCGISGFTNPLKDFWEYDPSTNSWTEKAGLPNKGLLGALSFSIGNKGYIGFGSDQDGYYQRGIWEYDPATDAWTRKNDFPGTTVYETIAISDSTHGYAGLGYDVSKYSYVKDFWRYDPSNDSWTQKKDFAGSPRFGERGFTVNNRIYIVGGDNGITYEFVNDLWEYDSDRDKWQSLGDFGGPPRSEAITFTIGNNGYVATGIDATSSGREMEDLWEFNTITQDWRQRADLGGGPRDMAASFGFGGSGIMATGEDGTRFKKDVWQYNPDSDTWTRTTDLTYGKRNATGFSIGSKMYIGLGLVDTSHSFINPTSLSKDFWAYDSINKSWTQLADFGGGLRGAAASFVINDKAYVGTGFGEINVKNDFWEYDPVSNSWNQKSNFPGKKRSYAASFAINGKGYAGMGIGTHGYMKDFYEYDPSTDAWIQKATFAGRQRAYNVSVAIGSKGYVGLGTDNKGKFIHDWWEFDPEANSWTQKTNFPAKGRWGASALNLADKAYVGMGVIDTLYATNDWWEYSPNADVRIRSEEYDAAPSLLLENNDFNWLQDNRGDLVMGIKTDHENPGEISWSVNNAFFDNYHNGLSWFGGNEKQVGAYLNRVVSASSANGFTSPATIRIYVSEKELSGFISYFNSKYHTDLTESDLRILQYSGPNADATVSNDEDSAFYYTSVKPEIGKYGVYNEYRYLEFTATSLSQFSIILTREPMAASASPPLSSPDFLLSPNPFSDQTDLKVMSNEEQPFRLRITDVDGKTIEEHSATTNQNIHLGKMLPKGVYFLSVENGIGNIPVQRIVKQ